MAGQTPGDRKGDACLDWSGKGEANAGRSTSSIVAIILVLPLPSAPAPSTASVVWSPDIAQLSAQNRGLAVNVSTQYPGTQGITAAIDVAKMAIASRRDAVLFEGNDTTDLSRMALDRQANLESAEAIKEVLGGSATPRLKALSLLDEALDSRPTALNTTSPRLLGYVAHQRRAGDVVENLTNSTLRTSSPSQRTSHAFKRPN